MKRLLLLALLGLGLTGPSAAEAFVSGTWEGRARCSGIFAGERRSVTFDAELRMSAHAGNEVVAVLDLEHESPGFRLSYASVTCGVLSDPEKGSSQLSIVGVIPPHLGHSVVHFTSVKTFPLNSKGQSGRLKGDGPLVLGPEAFFQCRYSLTRTGFFNPGFGLDRCS